MTGILLGPDALFLGVLASLTMMCTSSQQTMTPIPHSSAEIICVLVILIVVGMGGSILCELMHERRAYAIFRNVRAQKHM